MIDTVLLDMDGVISDTVNTHFTIDRQVLGENGINLSLNGVLAAHQGIKDGEFFNKIFRLNKTPEEIRGIEARKWEIAEQLPPNKIKPVEGLYHFLGLLKKRDMKLGIVSSSPRKFIDLVLSSLKISDMFRVVISCSDVKALKPSSEGLLLAAKRLFSEPSNCLVIDDGINGMLAAKEAKMHCIGLVREKRRLSYPADIIVGKLSDITLSLISSF